MDWPGMNRDPADPVPTYRIRRPCQTAPPDDAEVGVQRFRLGLLLLQRNPVPVVDIGVVESLRHLSKRRGRQQQAGSHRPGC